MAVTYTWTIAELERNTADGGVTVAHWRCEGVDGEATASSYGTTSWTPDASASDFIAFLVAVSMLATFCKALLSLITVVPFTLIAIFVSFHY